MSLLGLNSKDRKFTRDKANISNPKVNRGRAPLTANRISADCVQISLGPSIPYIPLEVYHTGGFNTMQTDGHTNRQAENIHGWMDQQTDVQVERGYFRLQTDRRMDGQTENLMPLTPKSRGIKMTDLFGGPKLSWNWTVGADIQHTYESSSNWYVKQDWCETSGNFFRKLPKTGFFTYFGAQSGPKIRPLRPIFSTPLKVFAMHMWSNTNVKPVKIFEKMTKEQNFDLFGRPKWSQNWDSVAHTPHTSKSTCNEHVKH